MAGSAAGREKFSPERSRVCRLVSCVCGLDFAGALSHPLALPLPIGNKSPPAPRALLVCVGSSSPAGFLDPMEGLLRLFSRAGEQRSDDHGRPADSLAAVN